MWWGFSLVRRRGGTQAGTQGSRGAGCGYQGPVTKLVSTEIDAFGNRITVRGGEVRGQVCAESTVAKNAVANSVATKKRRTR